MEMTRDYGAVQTIIALEQLANTPTSEPFSTLPKAWTVVASMTPSLTPTPNSAMATALKPTIAILQGPGFNNKIACYVDAGVQLLITGRNIDSTWFRVEFGQGQTCFRLDVKANRTNIIPDPNLQYWIFSSSWSISGNLSQVAIITPTSPLTPPTDTFSPAP
jgi:hypothetical protein